MTRAVRSCHRQASSNDIAKEVAFSIGRQLEDTAPQTIEGKTAYCYIIPASKTENIRLGENERKAATAIAEIASECDALGGTVTVDFPAEGRAETDLGNAQQRAVFSFDTPESGIGFAQWMNDKMSMVNREGFLNTIREKADLPAPQQAVGVC